MYGEGCVSVHPFLVRSVSLCNPFLVMDACATLLGEGCVSALLLLGEGFVSVQPLLGEECVSL